MHKFTCPELKLRVVAFQATSRCQARPISIDRTLANNGVFARCRQNESTEGLEDLFTDGLTPRQELEQILGRYSPRKLRNIPSLLEKYRGREKELIKKVRAKYKGVRAEVV